MVKPHSQIGKQGFQPVHGLTKTKIHKVWLSMLERCQTNSKKYSKNYSSRGIIVCERWRNFENFYEDMGSVPHGMSLDRINVDGNYTKENCRWANAKVQQNNRQNTRYLSINGEKVPLMVFAEKHGIKKNAAQYGYSFLKALQKAGGSITLWED